MLFGAPWCTKNYLLLNVSKTKELMVDFRKKKYISVEQVKCFRFLGITVTESLFSSWNISALVRKAQVRCLHRAHRY